ncbi:MAG: TetR/AcrR family transcriptional regulator, partial [Verrucomicrobiales bacterium]|nr:TetR/AcrR family transcriptional regulator [Verrucomicrobiales bacterium]
GDIADKAGMSRPSLYLVFPNKEDIFRGVIARKMDEFWRDTEAKLSQSQDLREGLEVVLETWVAEPCEMIHTSPESDELMEFAYSFAPDLRKQMLEMMEKQFLQAIRIGAPSKSSGTGESRLSDSVIARLIAVSTTEMKHSAADMAEVRKLLAATVDIYTSYLQNR